MNNPTDRVINRILEVDNFQNMACCCANFAEFCEEIMEWGVDHIAQVELFDTYRSFRDYTFNPELDINKLDAFIKTENGYIKQEAGPMNTKKGLNIEVTSGQYEFLYDLIMMAYELNVPEQKGWDLQTYDNLVDNVCQATETNLSNTVRGV